MAQWVKAVPAVAQVSAWSRVQSLAQELLHIEGVAKKKKKTGIIR